MTSLGGEKHCGFISDCCPPTTSPISKDLEYAIIQAIAFSLLQVIVFFGGCLVWTRYHCDWGFCRRSRSAEDAGACVACPFSSVGLHRAAYPSAQAECASNAPVPRRTTPCFPSPRPRPDRTGADLRRPA